MKPVHLFIFTTAAACALSACTRGDGVVIEEPIVNEDPLTVMERFETAYVGQWEKDGTCLDAKGVWDIADDSIRYGETLCRVDRLSRETAKVRITLTECRARGTTVTPPTLVLDIAGEDILYATRDDDRIRLERCPI